jgi:hypothetical protein
MPLPPPAPFPMAPPTSMSTPLPATAPLPSQAAHPMASTDGPGGGRGNCGYHHPGAQGSISLNSISAESVLDKLSSPIFGLIPPKITDVKS